MRVVVVLGVVALAGLGAFMLTPSAPKPTLPPPPACDLSPGGPLASAAIKGALTAEDLACVKDRLDSDQGTRASRVVMADAFLSGKTERWARLIEHHLNVFEPNDAELNYLFSLHQQR